MELIDPEYYAANGYPHEAWTTLRRDSPVHWYEGWAPRRFWAVTRRRELEDVSRKPSLFLSGPRTEVVSASDAPQIQGLVTMDPPDHGLLRRLIAHHFSRRAVGELRRAIEVAVYHVLEDAATGGEIAECDFVAKIASPYPIAVVSSMLGVPADDWRQMLHWTDEVIGSLDPDIRRPGESAEQTQGRAAAEMAAYLGDLLAARKAKPHDDLLSFLAHAELEGEPLDGRRILELAVLLIVAGSETTRNATSGALLAFVDHPEQWTRLRRDPSLVPSAVEEVLRWTSPVVHFARTAAEDTELAGRKIRRGDTLALFYASANRDEEVFDDPFAFRIDRFPNRHSAFGVGEHYCLGAHVARTELQVMLDRLVRRLEHYELCGPIERLRSSTVGGYRRLPIRYALSNASGA